MGYDKFKDNVVILTGASSGIGRELALLLASQGASLVLASRNLDQLDNLAYECTGCGGRAIAVKTDVGFEDQCKALIEQTVNEYGRIDTLINNAGYGIGGSLQDYSELDSFRNVIDVNFMGSVYCTFYSLPYIKKTRGRIIGVSSVLGKVAAWGHPSYSSSKFAMTGFFDNLRTELADSGVTVTMIYPGYVVTNFAGNVKHPDGSTLGEDGKKFYTDKMMSAEKCAQVIVKASAGRKRQKVLSGLAKFAVVMNFFFPWIVDKIAMGIRKQAKSRTDRIMKKN
jgi:NAD(P)-dependent dehydrogenase (short-subunit alcohol dehydrogenase family)